MVGIGSVLVYLALEWLAIWALPATGAVLSAAGACIVAAGMLRARG